MFRFFIFYFFDTCAVGHVECTTNSMWSSIWRKTVPHAWGISSKIMDNFVFQLNLHSSSVYLRGPNSEVSWPTRNNIRNGRIRCNVVHTVSICLRCVIDLPNVPTITEQEHDYWILAAFSILLHLILSWLLTVKFKFGIPGAMSSVILANWIPNLGQLMIIMRRNCGETRNGFSSLAFKDLWLVVKLFVSSCVMIW